MWPSIKSVLYCIWVRENDSLFVPMDAIMHLFPCLERQCGRWQYNVQCRWDVWKDSVFCPRLIEKQWQSSPSNPFIRRQSFNLTTLAIYRASGLKIKCTQKRHCRMVLCPSLKAVYLLFDFLSPGFWFVGPAVCLCSSPGHHWHLGQNHTWSDSGRWPGCQGKS